MDQPLACQRVAASLATRTDDYMRSTRHAGVRAALRELVEHRDLATAQLVLVASVERQARTAGITGMRHLLPLPCCPLHGLTCNGCVQAPEFTGPVEHTTRDGDLVTVEPLNDWIDVLGGGQ